MREFLARAARRVPFVGSLTGFLGSHRLRQYEWLTAQQQLLCFPAGHYYSPILSREERDRLEQRPRFIPREIPGIDLNDHGQRKLLEGFKEYYREQPFSETKQANRRYYFENPFYSYSDALCLYFMIRHLRPRRIIEAGSGFSSCVTLDTNELFFNNAISCTFVEPDPERFLSLIHAEDKNRIELLATPLQEVELSRFESLEPNDIFFIDSSHVCKPGSDVQSIYWEILPRLASGVYIHIHDIFYPFEYPMSWIKEGRAFNELYLLRAFLQYNSQFRIELFNTYLEQLYEEDFRRDFPLCLKNLGGSIWLRRM